MDTDADGIGDARDACPNDPLNDVDADGVCGDVDACEDSNLTATIVIDGLDSGVANKPLGDGCTMSDEIASLAAAARNHGDFISGLAALTRDWVRQWLITSIQRAEVINAAAQSGIGKEKG